VSEPVVPQLPSSSLFDESPGAPSWAKPVDLTEDEDADAAIDANVANLFAEQDGEEGQGRAKRRPETLQAPSKIVPARKVPPTAGLTTDWERPSEPAAPAEPSAPASDPSLDAAIAEIVAGARRQDRRKRAFFPSLEPDVDGPEPKSRDQARDFARSARLAVRALGAILRWAPARRSE
jgi:hypothetical protein